ncbi:MAG: Rieske 2Fe-2S domain-containing protein [Candidatus Binatia bacterium]
MSTPNTTDELRHIEEIRGIRETEQVVREAQSRQAYKKYLEAELGLRNHWYPIFFGQELKEGEMRGEMLLGERILYKRAGGKVYAVADRCPHRGVAFSARPECYSQNTVTCWFHGFTFDVRDGKLVAVLTESNSSVVGKMTVRTYPVEEVNGVVFTFVGDLDPPPPATLDIQPKFFRPGLAFHPCMRHKIKCNWRLAAELGYDAAHVYGHRTAELVKRFKVVLPLSTYPSRKDVVRVIEGEGPKGVIKKDDINVWKAEVEGTVVAVDNIDPDNPPDDEFDIEVGLFMPCGLQVEPFPLPGMIHFEWYVPIDEDHHMYMITQAYAPTDEADEARFHDECENVLGPLIWQPPGVQPEGFNNYDAFIREQVYHAYKHEGFWQRERLYKPDYIVVQWRMLVSKYLRGIQRRTGDWARPEGWSPTGDDYSPNRSPGRW